MNENNSIVFDNPNTQPIQNPPVPNSQPDTNQQPVNNPSTIERETKFPHWYTRAAAYLVDVIIINLVAGILATILFLLFTLLKVNEVVAISIAGIIGFSLIFIYYSYFLSKEGATLGLKFLGLKIVKEDGSYISFGKALLRTFIFQLVTLINMIMILVTQKKQGLHDLATGTVCINVNEQTSKAKWFLGCYCGCSILAILIPIILGIGTFLSNPQSIQKQLISNPTITQEKPNFEDIELNTENDFDLEEDKPLLDSQLDNQMEENNLDINPTTPITGIGSEFYKACMQANTNPNINLSDYCVCAEEEYMATQDLNSVINKCKNLIMMR